MARHRITMEDSGEEFACDESQTVLLGMEALGRRGIPVGCRNGGCGVCKVEVTHGRYVARIMSRAHISTEDEAAGRVLSCRIRPVEDLRLRVIGAMKKGFAAPRPAEGPDATAPRD
jgi:ferredoxin